MWTSFSCVTLCVLVLGQECTGLDFVYHNYTALKDSLEQLSQSYPQLTNLYTIGKSVQGRDLWVMAVGESPRDHVSLRPHVKYVGNIHGNEVTSRETLLHLLEYLLVNYGTNTTVTSLLDSTTIHILPSMNPDGFEVSYEGNCTDTIGRENANGFDLNRNFPDYFEENNVTRQPETLAVMDWMKSTNFALSAGMHGGIALVNYPFDNYKNVWEPKYSRSPDDDILRHISLIYTRTHPTMHLGKPCPGSRTSFEDGITNGAAWYPTTGCMQDYSYIFHGCMEVTIEMTCCKYPIHDQLEAEWNSHREPLIAFIQQVNVVGVRGLVTDKDGGAVKGATLSIGGREAVPFRTSKYGEYWRILLPGNYKLKVSADGYESTSKSFQILSQTITTTHITLDIASTPSGANHVFSGSLMPLAIFTVVSAGYHILISTH